MVDAAENALIRRLIRAGADSDDEIDALLKDVGLSEVARVLVDEVRFRCPEPANTAPVDVALDLTHGGERHSATLRVVRDEPVRLVAEESAKVRSRITFTAAGLLRRLFGPVDSPRTGDFHNTFMPTPEDPGQLRELLGEMDTVLRAAAQATATLTAGCTGRAPELGELSIRYGSDKWASFHWYTAHYERHFARYRDQPVRVLEIGIGGFEDDLGGGSLKMWKRYFPRGTVFGLDLYDKTSLSEPRLTALVGDQNDPDFLTELAREHGPFDIVIDDGSHLNEHVRTSFRALFPHVRPGGLYVVEDLQTAYYSDFGGSPGGVAGPDTSLGLVKELIDDLHHREHRDPTVTNPTPTQSSVVGVHAYHNIVFVEKGTNGEDTLPRWMDADVWTALGAK
ncbi:class I SAM-dependent methyltransferase [Kitasatospora sp. SUK 42]|uniref:class I SAM-dependent methyltransferase n=1 Tax=Kitasatospora sp. SUK 42 TaxID=1588882 RepID=UPI001C315ED9|nr:class I SAM-dependent methyltransferase [Kitasatospora sp. SUK 42]MBV2153209.1 class I SAM-dependent methyltransferase [Kitasatospora sp. SUK 42]